MPDYTYQTKAHIESTADLGLTVVSSTIVGDIVTTVLTRVTPLSAADKTLLDEYFAKKGMQSGPTIQMRLIASGTVNVPGNGSVSVGPFTRNPTERIEVATYWKAAGGGSWSWGSDAAMTWKLVRDGGGVDDFTVLFEDVVGAGDDVDYAVYGITPSP